MRTFPLVTLFMHFVLISLAILPALPNRVLKSQGPFLLKTDCGKVQKLASFGAAFLPVPVRIESDWGTI
jgi:hypothetical protein